MEDRDTITFGLVEDVFVLIHRHEQVDEREWQDCIREAKRSKSLSRLLLVPGPALPDVGRRYDIVELHEEHGMRVAVLSDLSATGRVVTALKWAGIEAEGFGIDDLDGMLTFLERTYIRARMSSMLGPYLERSWLQDIASFTPAGPQPVEAGH